MKQNFLKTMAFSLIVIVIVSACTWWFEGPPRPDEPPMPVEAPQVGEDLQITGPVIDTIDDCAFDGICALAVDTKDYGLVYVIWSEGMTINGCSGQYEGEIGENDEVEAFGQVTELLDGTAITICPSADYYVRSVGD
ncbi:MAG: hypothetical protein KC546_02090 [Anaerolineae bacterium]|nr:hypothetical protein [Anaerolineae bacterium]MCA9887126.1 hypothetical protein [Anaerolineae bacterium]